MGTDLFKALFLEPNPAVVVEGCERLASADIAALEDVIEVAVHGRRSAVRTYVRTYSRLIDRLIRTAHERRPTLVVEVESDHFAIVDAEGTPSRFSELLLRLGAIEAPFSPWVIGFGPGRGVMLSLVSDFRTALVGCEPLSIPKELAKLPHWTVDHVELGKFVRSVVEELHVDRTSAADLERVKRLFDLSNSELARLFGTSRQAATSWLIKGVPSARLPKLHTVLNAGELLERQLKPGRIAAVARQRADAYGGISMLEMISAGRQEELLEDIRRSFDWAATA
jgi:hypothetical protein